MLKKSIFFFLIGAYFYSALTTYGQNLPRELHVGVWKLLDMETFSVHELPDKPKPFTYSKSKAEPYPRMDFRIDYHNQIFQPSENIAYGYAIEGNRFNIYPVDKNEGLEPINSYLILDYNDKVITLQRRSGDFVYRYYYQLSE